MPVHRSASNEVPRTGSDPGHPGRDWAMDMDTENRISQCQLQVGLGLELRESAAAPPSSSIELPAVPAADRELIQTTSSKTRQAVRAGLAWDSSLTDERRYRDGGPGPRFSGSLVVNPTALPTPPPRPRGGSAPVPDFRRRDDAESDFREPQFNGVAISPTTPGTPDASEHLGTMYASSGAAHIRSMIESSGPRSVAAYLEARLLVKLIHIAARAAGIGTCFGIGMRIGPAHGDDHMRYAFAVTLRLAVLFCLLNPCLLDARCVLGSTNMIPGWNRYGWGPVNVTLYNGDRVTLDPGLSLVQLPMNVLALLCFCWLWAVFPDDREIEESWRETLIFGGEVRVAPLHKLPKMRRLDKRGLRYLDRDGFWDLDQDEPMIHATVDGTLLSCRLTELTQHGMFQKHIKKTRRKLCIVVMIWVAAMVSEFDNFVGVVRQKPRFLTGGAALDPVELLGSAPLGLAQSTLSRLVAFSVLVATACVCTVHTQHSRALVADMKEQICVSLANERREPETGTFSTMSPSRGHVPDRTESYGTKAAERKTKLLVDLLRRIANESSHMRTSLKLVTLSSVYCLMASAAVLIFEVVAWQHNGTGMTGRYNYRTGGLAHLLPLWVLACNIVLCVAGANGQLPGGRHSWAPAATRVDALCLP